MVERDREMPRARDQSDKSGNAASGNPRKRARAADTAAGNKPSFNMKSDGPVEWKKIKQEQRDLTKKRKEKKRADFYEVSMAAKQLWEQFRIKRGTVPKEARKKACDEAYNLLQPHLKKCIGLHDMSRVVQSIIDVGGRGVCKNIFDSLAPDIIELSKDKYACHTILKLLPTVGKEERQIVMNQARGNIEKLLKHKFSAPIVEILYSTCTKKQDRVQMLMECFGPEFKLCTDSSCTSMDELLVKSPDKRERVLSSVKVVLDKAIRRRGYLKETMLMELMCQYLRNCDDEARAEYIESLKETLVNVYDSREGANLAMICIWNGTAQTRKSIVKSFKTKVVDMARSKFGHVILLALFDCVDDTKLISKTLIKELAEHLSADRGGENSKNLFLNQYARKVLCYLISPRDPRMINGDIIKMLEKGDGNLHSKKDRSKRSQELSEYALEMILPVVKEYGEALHNILNNSCPALIIIGFVNASTSEDISAILTNIAEWYCNVDEPRFHTKVIKTLTSKDDARTVKFAEILSKTMTAYPKVAKLWNEDLVLKQIISS